MAEIPSLARSLAEAAFLLANEANDLPAWSSSLTRLAGRVSAAMAAEAGRGVQVDPEALAKRCLEGVGDGLPEAQRHFIGILSEKKRLHLLPDIARLFNESVNKQPRAETPKTDTTGVAAGDAGASGISFEFDMLDLDAMDENKPEVVNVRAGLEDIGHLAGKICGIWGTQELDSFLTHLVMDSRDGSRQGLPLAVAAEIVFLAGLNKIVRAINFAEANSVTFEHAFTVIDDGDQARHKHDVWDEPNNSRSTAPRPPRGAAGPSPSVGSRRASRSQFGAVIELLLMLLYNKWVLGALAVFLTAKFFWK